MAPDHFGDLDPEHARPARAAVDEDPVTPLHVGDDALVCGQRGGAGRGGVVRVDTVRERDAAGARGGDELAERAELGGRVEATEDELAGLQDGGQRCAGDDDAAAVVDPGGGGRGRDEGAEDGQFGDFVVDWVDRHADYFDRDLFGA